MNSVDYEVAGDIPASGGPGGAEDSTKQDENYHKAIATDELMLALSPYDFDVQHAYATDLVSLGVILTYHEKDLNAALACFKKELGIDQKLREHSADTRYARGVAVAYSHLGQAYDRLGDTQQSLENFAQGLGVSRELALADPKKHFLSARSRHRLRQYCE